MLLHSTVGIITNSTTTIYTLATEETIKAAIVLLEALGGNKDEFAFTLVPGDEILDKVYDAPDEYLSTEQGKHLVTLEEYVDRIKYIADLIISKELADCPTEDDDGYEYPWDLSVTRNGQPFTEFKDFFDSFDQEAFYG